MTDRQLWCRVRLIGRGGVEAGCYSLEGYGDPDLTAADVVARLCLLAERTDRTFALEDVSEAMVRLLDLAGLGVEVQRKAEGREEPGRV